MYLMFVQHSLAFLITFCPQSILRLPCSALYREESERIGWKALSDHCCFSREASTETVCREKNHLHSLSQTGTQQTPWNIQIIWLSIDSLKRCIDMCFVCSPVYKMHGHENSVLIEAISIKCTDMEKYFILIMVFFMNSFIEEQCSTCCIFLALTCILLYVSWTETFKCMLVHWELEGEALSLQK